MLEIQAERLALALAHTHLADAFPIRFQHAERQPRVVAVKFVIQHITDRCPIDLQQSLPRPQSRTRRRTARIHTDNF